MTEERLPPDSEGAMRSYLRAHSGVQAQFGGASARVFFAAPDTAEYPLVTLGRIGGGRDRAANIDQALIQINVWGSPRDKASCWTATAAVLGALRDLDATPATVAGKGVLHSAGESSYAWLPDPASERARYVITVPVTTVPV